MRRSNGLGMVLIALLAIGLVGWQTAYRSATVPNADLIAGNDNYMVTYNHSTPGRFDLTEIDATVSTAITASATQTQAGATQLSDNARVSIHQVTVIATDDDPVALPACAAGKRVMVINDDASGTQRLQIFPNNGQDDVIDDLAADASVTLNAGDKVWFVGVDADQWYRVNPLTPNDNLAGLGDVSTARTNLEVTKVVLSAPADGELLTYDSGLGYYINATTTEAGVAQAPDLTDSVSAAGTTQGTATALTTTYSYVTTITPASAEGVKLATVAANSFQAVINLDATDNLDVYPDTSDAINGGAVNAAIVVPPNSITIFRGRDTTNWYSTIPLIFSSAQFGISFGEDQDVIGSAGGLTYDVPTGDVYNWDINATDELTLSATSLDLHSNELAGVGSIDATTESTIEAALDTLGAISFGDNNITNVGTISLDGILPDATDVTMMSGGGNVILGGAATATRLRFLEPSGSGTNYTEFLAGAQAANQTYTLPTDAPADGEFLSWNTGGTLSWEAGGGGSPGGVDTQIQYNNGGAFGGMAGFAWDDTLNELTVTAQAADDTPLQIVAFAAQSANLLELTSDGGTAGDLVTFDSGGSLDFHSNGNASTPTITFGDADSGIWGDGANRIMLGANSGEKLRVDAQGPMIFDDIEFQIGTSDDVSFGWDGAEDVFRLVTGTNITTDANVLVEWDDDESHIRYGPASTVSTTDATLTTLMTIGTVTDSGYHFTATVKGIQTTDYSEVATYVIAGSFKNDGGTVTQAETTTTIHSGEDTTGWPGATFAISGTNVLLQVQGVAATNITWTGHLEEL